MPKALKLEGRRFGALVVTKRAGSYKYNDKSTGKPRLSFSRWECQCDCGEICFKTSRPLISGTSVRCGWLCRSVVKPSKYTNGTLLGKIYGVYRSNAGRRNLEFSLTENQFLELVTSDCYYTGRSPTRTIRNAKKTLTPLAYNGIDRIDPDKGYTMENCVPCCYEVNRAKSNMREEDFLSLVADIARTRKLV